MNNYEIFDLGLRKSTWKLPEFGNKNNGNKNNGLWF